VTRLADAIRHDDLRRRNRALVLSAVRRAGTPSRTDIAQRTGLSHSTISAIASDLMSEGVVHAIGVQDQVARRGRPQVSLGLNRRAASIVVVVLLLNSLSVALVDYAGATVAETSRRLDTQALDGASLKAEIERDVAEILAQAAGDAGPLMRIVMAVQGVTDSAGRRLMWSPITHEADIDFADHFETVFAVPTTLENDCNMIAVAVGWRQPEIFHTNFVAILLSNGIGMGLMLKGAPFAGSHSSGGEFGHMIHIPDGARCRCGRNGCVEAYAGNYAILRNALGQDARAEPMADIDQETMRRLAAAARDHEGLEREAFRAAGNALGFALGSLFALIDPAPIAMVGPGTSAFDIMEPTIRDAIARTAGGQHGPSAPIEIYPDENSLIRGGAELTALFHLDDKVFAPGLTAGRQVRNQASLMA